MQRALMQSFKPENYQDVRQALEQAGRLDLIGQGPDCLIPARPPKGAGGKKGHRARGGKPTNKTGTTGYRPGRRTAKRRK